MNGPLLPALPGYDNPQLIAHGTTALVFLATQVRLNRPVAIKVITADTGSVPVNAARELATTVALSSQPHIVSIIDTGVTEDDRPYIVMEYCEGGSYAQILRTGGLLPVDDVLEVGIKIGEALHAAHQAGIVHRDVKPSNILRSRFGPALTDFGIARAPDELGGTLTREMMTPHHASPEALLHQAQSGRSDIYSLASTMWTLLTGHPPFVDPGRPAVDMYAFRDRVLHDPLPPLRRDDVPPWLLQELQRAMAKLPSARHASAFAFAEALRRGTLGLSPTPGPVAEMVSEPAVPGSPRPDASYGAATGAGTPSGAGSASGGGRAGVPVHVPGVPPQAWPEPVPPAAGRPVPTASGRGTAEATASVGADEAPASGTPGRKPVSGAVPSFLAPPTEYRPPPRVAPPAARPATPTPSPAPSDQARPASPRSEPLRPAPSGSDPSPSGALRPDPSRVEPLRSDPSRSEPLRSEPSRSDPPRSEPSRSDPSRSDPSRSDPSRSDPSRSDPSRSEPSRSEPSRPDPSRHDLSSAEVSRPDLVRPGSTPTDSAGLAPAQPDLGRRDAGRPDTGRSEPGWPDPGRSDTDRPDLSRTGSRLEARPEARSDLELDRELDLDTAESGEGGWLGAYPSTSDTPAERHFDDLRPLAPDRQRGTLIAVLIGTVVLAVAAAAIGVLASNRDDPAEADLPVNPAPTQFISAQVEGQPRDIRITEDKGNAVTIGWTDPTPGTVTFVVVGTGPNGEKLETKSIHRGTHTTTYSQLNPQNNYCFVVGAVYAVDSVALAPQVCTKR
jgi:serine/threonine protein kinase